MPAAEPLPPPGADCSTTLTPEKKAAVGRYVTALGPELRKRYGKQPHYTPQQVRGTAQDQGLSVDYLCFAYVMYCTPADFSLIHAAAGEPCDYGAMRALVGDTFFNGALDFDVPAIADVLFSAAGGVAGGGVLDADGRDGGDGAAEGALGLLWDIISGLFD